VAILLIYFAAFLLAAITAFASLPLWRFFCWRVDLVDDPGHRKIHTSPTALAGGLAVMTGLLAPLCAAWILMYLPGLHIPWLASWQHGFSRRETQIGALFLGAAGMLFLGLLDDRFELRPAAKFAGQFVIAFLVAFSGIRITLFIPSLFISYAITILWIVTVTNAFNFMDNMNGLCAGLGAIAAWIFAWNAAIHGQYLVALLAFLSCGALLGFLPWNFPRASAFLGDAGSHLTGFWLATLAILPHFHTASQPNRWAVLSPLLVLALPLFDLCWVVCLRWSKGQPFYIGDTNHLSHRLVRLGLSRTTAVLAIWFMAALVGGTTFLLF
jgi:UDP-GlcNAc:undecaprenyl-phosphate GlcNAc-1-phosphate transferase